MLIAQISDLHIKPAGEKAYGVVDTEAALKACVAAIMALPRRPDMVLATGDLVDAGLPEEYERLRALLAPLDMPVHPIVGNHDDRANLRIAFPDLPATGPFVQYTVDNWPVRIVALDSLIPGKTHGELCAERLGWLDEALAARPDMPTVVMVHHPPFDTGLQMMDRLRLARPEELAGVIARHKQVLRILCGHVHRPIQALFAGTLAVACPSSAHQMLLDIDPAQTPGFMLEPAGFMLHLLASDGLVTHTVPVGDWPGPYPFRRAGGPKMS
jgi:Icc protein